MGTSRAERSIWFVSRASEEADGKTNGRCVEVSGGVKTGEEMRIRNENMRVWVEDEKLSHKVVYRISCRRPAGFYSPVESQDTSLTATLPSKSVAAAGTFGPRTGMPIDLSFLITRTVPS